MLSIFVMRWHYILYFCNIVWLGLVLQFFPKFFTIRILRVGNFESTVTLYILFIYIERESNVFRKIVEFKLFGC